MKISRTIALLTLSLMTVSVLPLASQELDLVRNENAIGQAVAARLLTDVYKKAGLSLKITPVPGARANSLALAGEKDGEVARIPAYFAKNTSLFKVEPAYYYLTTGVFAKEGKTFSVKSKGDLKNYKVGIVRGIAHAESATEGLTGVVVVDNYDTLYKMLDAGRIELGIDEGINGPVTLRALGIKGIVQIAEIARLDLNHVLIEKNKGLAPKISAAIKAMKDSGELAKLTKAYEAEETK